MTALPRRQQTVTKIEVVRSMTSELRSRQQLLRRRKGAQDLYHVSAPRHDTVIGCWEC